MRATDYGLEIEGWTLPIATGVSADGLTIVGYGTNPRGDTEAWIVRLQLETPGELDGDGVVGITDLLILLAFWGPCGDTCLGDLDCDGTVGILDLLILLSNWG